MLSKRTGLKYKFIAITIATIIITTFLGSLTLHYLIKSNPDHLEFYITLVSIFYIIIGVTGVLIITKLMVQPVVSLTEKVHQVKQGNLNVEITGKRKGTRLDEMDRLFEGFEHMVLSLKENIEALTQAKERAEKYSRELFESKKKLEAIFNGISDGIMIISQDFRIVNANHVIQRIMGRSLDEICGQHCYEMCNGTTNRCSFCRAELAFKTGQHVATFCTKMIEEDGEEKVFEVHDFPLYNDKGEIDQIIEYVKDVTEAVRMQARLENARHLATIGEMAAKVAHEVRNPLNAIKGASHYLRNEVYNEDARSYLNLIEEQVERVNKVATALLDLSKPLETVLYPGNLEKVIKRSLQITESQIKTKKIKTIEEIEPDLPSIPLDEEQMEQVMVNLILNAIEAMNKGGELKIKVNMDRNGIFNSDGKIKIIVSDNGCGIDGHQVQKLFNPFFTTKTKGTGLGLTIVKKIIDNHQGNIDFQSRKGRGTEVTISLPLEIKKYETEKQNTGS